MNNNIDRRLNDVESVFSSVLPGPKYVLEWARTFRDFWGLLDSSTMEVMNRLAEKALKGMELAPGDLATIDNFNESFEKFMNYSDREGEMLFVHWADCDNRVLPEEPAFDQFLERYREKHIIKISFTSKWKTWRATHPLSLKEFRDFRASPVVEAKSSAEPKVVDKNAYPIFVSCD